MYICYTIINIKEIIYIVSCCSIFTYIKKHYLWRRIIIIKKKIYSIKILVLNKVFNKMNRLKILIMIFKIIKMIFKKMKMKYN